MRLLVPIARGLGEAIAVLFGAYALLFLLFHVVGGDPALRFVGDHASPERLALLRHQLGLDRALAARFFVTWADFLSFDFGRSWMTHEPVARMIVRSAGATLSVAVPAFVLTHFLAVFLGLLGVARHRALLDRALVIASVVGASIPALAFVLLGQYWLAYRWQLFPVFGYELGWDERWRYVLLPILIWVLIALGPHLRLYREILLAESRRDFLWTARAKGLSEFRIYFHHLLRACLAPLFSVAIAELPFLLLGSFVLERFFGIPGLGNLVIEATQGSDLPVLLGTTFVLTVAFVIVNRLTDALVRRADPRGGVR